MKSDETESLKEQILLDAWRELHSLEGDQLSEFLQFCSVDAESLLRQFNETAKAAKLATKRERFEAARRRIHSHPPTQFNVVSFELSEKMRVLAAIRERAARSNEMTIAARNQKIDAEEDADAFLDACVRLGVIDQNGNLRD